MTTKKDFKRMLREYTQRRACLAPPHPDDVFFQSHAELPSFTLPETDTSSETLPVTGASTETLPETGASSETLPETDTSSVKRRQRRARMFGELCDFSETLPDVLLESFGVLFVSKTRPPSSL